MKRLTITPKFVDSIPEQLNEGILYICEKYYTAAHKCCCGCGEEVITPLTPADWSIRKEGNTVTLHPSIGNWSFPCRSHYWLKRNQVVWASGMTLQQINRVRERDLADKATYIAAVNRRKESQTEPKFKNFKPADTSGSLPHQIWQTLIRWLK